MASRSTRNNSRATDPRSDLNEEIRGLNLVIRKSRAWKATDVDAILLHLAKLNSQGLTHYFRNEPTEETTQANQRIVAALIEFLPHLAREIHSLDFRGRTPGGVTTDKLTLCVQKIYHILDAFGASAANELEVEKPFYQQALAEFLLPAMEFIHNLLTHGDALARHEDVRHAVIGLLRYLFSARDTGGEDRTVLRTFPAVCEVVTRLADCIERESEGLGLISIPVFRCIWAKTAPGYDTLPAEIEKLVLTYIRVIMRTNALPSQYFAPGQPSEDVNFILNALGSWAQWHTRHACQHIPVSITIEHFAAFPWLLEWCSHEDVIRLTPDYAACILYIFCVAFVNANPATARLNANDAVRTLRCALTILKECWNVDSVHTTVMGSIHILLHDKIPHSAEFVDLLDDASLLLIIVQDLSFTPTRSTITGALVALKLCPKLLEKFLSAEDYTAQALLNTAIHLDSDTFFNPHHAANTTRHSLDLIHFALKATASLDNISFDHLHENAASMLDDIGFTPATPANMNVLRRDVDLLFFLYGHNVETDRRIRAAFCDLMDDIYRKDLSHELPFRVHGTEPSADVLPWSAEGCALRARCLDLCMTTLFWSELAEDDEKERNCKSAIVSWWNVILTQDGPTLRRESNELRAHALYHYLLQFDFAQTVRINLPAIDLAQFASVLLTLSAANITPLMCEYGCLALWAYCALHLPLEPPSEKLDRLRVTWRDYCQAIVDRPKRKNDSDPRTREAAHEILRLLDDYEHERASS